MLVTIFSLIVLLFSIAIHETSHGFVAYKLGDPTAKYEGRLSLNPLDHLDPIGSFLFPVLMLILTAGRGPIFGWAKPVPINPHNFRDQRWGELKTALAGPLSNILLALSSGLILRFFFFSGFPSTSLGQILFYGLSITAFLNLALAFFNLLPIPPLDGSHILTALLPSQAWKIKSFFQRYGILILILVMFSGLNFIGPLVNKSFYLITGFYFPL